MLTRRITKKKGHWIYRIGWYCRCCPRWLCLCKSRRFRRAACYLCSLNMVLQMMLALVVGAAIGVGVYYSFATMDDQVAAYKHRKELVDWISWPGVCFLRLMKACDLPLIACNIIVGVSGLIKVRQAGKVGVMTGVWYMLSALMASGLATVSFLLFRPMLKQLYSNKAVTMSKMAFSCGTSLLGSPLYLEFNNATGAFSCSATSPQEPTSLFPVDVFPKTSDGYYGRLVTVPPIPRDSVGEIMHYIVDNFTPDNVLEAFVDNNVLGTVAVSVFLGLAIERIIPQAGQARNVLADVVLQVRDTMTLLATWAMQLAGPIGACSLVAGAFAGNKDPLYALQDYGVLFAGLVASYAVFCLVLMPLLHLVFANTNPFRYLRLFVASYKEMVLHGHMTDEILEETIETAVEKGKVAGLTAGFVLPLGLDMNLTGSSVYYPFATLWLAYVGGYWEGLSSGALAVIGLVAVASVIGAQHFPNYGLIMILTIWTAIFAGQYKVPLEIGVLLTLDWGFARLVALANLTSDIVIAKMVSEMCESGASKQQVASRRNLLKSLQQTAGNLGGSVRRLDKYVSYGAEGGTGTGNPMDSPGTTATTSPLTPRGRTKLIRSGSNESGGSGGGGGAKPRSSLGAASSVAAGGAAARGRHGPFGNRGASDDSLYEADDALRLQSSPLFMLGAAKGGGTAGAAFAAGGSGSSSGDGCGGGSSPPHHVSFGGIAANSMRVIQPGAGGAVAAAGGGGGGGDRRGTLRSASAPPASGPAGAPSGSPGTGTSTGPGPDADAGFAKDVASDFSTDSGFAVPGGGEGGRGGQGGGGGRRPRASTIAVPVDAGVAERLGSSYNIRFSVGRQSYVSASTPASGLPPPADGATIPLGSSLSDGDAKLVPPGHYLPGSPLYGLAQAAGNPMLGIMGGSKPFGVAIAGNPMAAAVSAVAGALGGADAYHTGLYASSLSPSSSPAASPGTGYSGSGSGSGRDRSPSASPGATGSGAHSVSHIAHSVSAHARLVHPGGAPVPVSPSASGGYPAGMAGIGIGVGVGMGGSLSARASTTSTFGGVGGGGLHGNVLQVASSSASASAPASRSGRQSRGSVYKSSAASLVSQIKGGLAAMVDSAAALPGQVQSHMQGLGAGMGMGMGTGMSPHMSMHPSGLSMSPQMGGLPGSPMSPSLSQSGGIMMPDGSVLSAEAVLAQQARMNAITAQLQHELAALRATRSHSHSSDFGGDSSAVSSRHTSMHAPAGMHEAALSGFASGPGSGLDAGGGGSDFAPIPVGAAAAAATADASSSSRARRSTGMVGAGLSPGILAAAAASAGNRASRHTGRVRPQWTLAEESEENENDEEDNDNDNGGDGDGEEGGPDADPDETGGQSKGAESEPEMSIDGTDGDPKASFSGTPASAGGTSSSPAATAAGSAVAANLSSHSDAAASDRDGAHGSRRQSPAPSATAAAAAVTDSPGAPHRAARPTLSANPAPPVPAPAPPAAARRASAMVPLAALSPGGHGHARSGAGSGRRVTMVLPPATDGAHPLAGAAALGSPAGGAGRGSFAEHEATAAVPGSASGGDHHSAPAASPPAGSVHGDSAAPAPASVAGAAHSLVQAAQPSARLNFAPRQSVLAGAPGAPHRRATAGAAAFQHSGGSA